MIRKTKALFFLCGIFLPLCYGYAQTQDNRQKLDSVVGTINNYHKRLPAEALYVQYDKPYYVVGDTLWYKVYLFDAAELIVSESKFLHIELYNARQEQISRFVLPLIAGLGWGCIPLEGKGFEAGTLTLRAYTNWMRNFKTPFYTHTFQIGATANNDGIPPSAGPTRRQQGGVASVPESTIKADVQFMPEGGSLVAGCTTGVAFKAIGPDGRGIRVFGRVLNKKQEEVTQFESQYAGMGIFPFTPQADEKYTALVSLPDGSKQTFPLPAISATGTTLSVSNFHACPNLIIDVATTTPNRTLYLLAQCRGIDYYGVVLQITGKEVTVEIPKSGFPSGVARLTVLDENFRPLNERLTYIDNQDQLKINISPNKTVFKKRDSVALDITVTDKKNNPVPGSFSLAVTDNGLVVNDSFRQENLLTKILLQEGIKGTIENPGHYLSSTQAAKEDLEILLLTQGWTGFDWSEVLAPPTAPKYKPEATFEVNGRLSNIINKSVTGAKITLLSVQPFFVKEVLTDDKGQFSFREFPVIDTPSFVISALNKRGKAFNIGVEIDQVEPPAPLRSREFPAVIRNRPDSALQRYVAHKQLSMAEEQSLLLKSGVRRLAGVEVKAKRIVKTSSNLNGPGNADQIVTEEEVMKAGKMTLLELLETKVKGFRRSTSKYAIVTSPINFIFDGIDLEWAHPINIQDITSVLNYYTAEDIVGVEVMQSMKYTSNYNSAFDHGYAPDPSKNSYIEKPAAYIEITTRGKQGPYMKATPGRYLFKADPNAWPRQQFYRPAYTVRDTVSALKDTRSTLYWEPMVLTDAKGKATVTFYTSDREGDCTIMIEGANMNGLIGSQKSKITIEK